MYELVRDVSVVKAGTKGLMDRLRLTNDAKTSEIRIGRTSANQLRLQPEGKESMGLSRYHARLVRMKKKDGWMLVDNKSTNGTYVNSIKIAQLKPYVFFISNSHSNLFKKLEIFKTRFMYAYIYPLFLVTHSFIQKLTLKQLCTLT